MRILIGADTYAPHVNGAAAFAQRLAVALTVRHEVHVAVPSTGYRSSTGMTRDGVVEHRVRSLPMPGHPGFRFCAPLGLRAEARRILDEVQPDVLHVQSHFPLCRALIEAARSRKILIVATNHFMPENLVHYLPIGEAARLSVHGWAWRDAARVFALADVVTAPTPYAAALATVAGVPGPVLPISNGVDLARFRSHTETGSQVDGGSQAGVSASFETGSRAGTGSWAEAGSRAESGSQAGSGSPAGVGSCVGTGSRAETDSQPGFVSPAEVGSWAGTGSRTEGGSHVGVGSRAEIGSRSEIGEFRLRYGVPDKPAITYVGRLDAEKNLDVVIRAFAKVRASMDAQLLLVGAGAERPKLSELAAEMNISEHVTFTGFVPDEDLPSAYAATTVFVNAGTAELQSLVTLEAMASGRPVVGADAAALPHLVENGGTGYLFPPGDSDALADRLMLLLGDPQHAQALGRKARAVAEQHDESRTVAAFEQLYAIRRAPAPAEVPA
ncbi:glycosyltransferase [Actinoplanes sp. Pm04-4]|uniref:Glycosyltransferase n=1 Tax=Paractinoplanes pyxinae TaxID=2997416 RepID=A0ABT4BFB1_9ACTN|nr:glycosyltransferase [Actinoplanes pyxinae]MCY1144255.1 glycosyltransferase [Actinoplanes pyxinae]